MSYFELCTNESVHLQERMHEKVEAYVPGCSVNADDEKIIGRRTLRLQHSLETQTHRTTAHIPLLSNNAITLHRSSKRVFSYIFNRITQQNATKYHFQFHALIFHEICRKLACAPLLYIYLRWGCGKSR